jgi:D-amino peptidase
MKVFISVDMEGISGIVDTTMTSRDHPDYEKGRALMVKDVNACIEGILSAGPAEITVCDGHGGMNNINPEDLNQAAALVRGSPKPQSQTAALDSSYDACIFVGYHSHKGTLHGVLSHTYSGASVESLHINGVEVGETAMNAGIAGHHGVPLIMVTGDQAVAAEAKSLSQDIETAIVKTAIGRRAAICLHPEKARQLIRDTATKAVKNRRRVKPVTYNTPVTYRIRFTDATRADAAAFIPGAKRLDGKTVELTAPDYIMAYHGFIAAVLCAQAASQ